MAAKKRKKVVRKKPVPRLPRAYTEKIAESICKRLAAGESLREVCRDPKMPNRCTVAGWVVDDFMGFASQYARARQAQIVDALDEIDELTVVIEGKKTDPTVLQEKRLRVDAIKWKLCKVLPKIYGDKLAVGGDADAPPIQLSDGDVQQQIEALFDEVKKGSKKGKKT